MSYGELEAKGLIVSEIDNDRLCAIAEAERDGRLVVLPCEMQDLKDAISEISYSEGCMLDVLDLAKYGNCKMDCFECLTNAIAEAALSAGKENERNE